MNVLIGDIIIGISVVMVFIGMFGFYRFKDFYSKLLASATIDTTALVTFLIGAMIRGGLTWGTLKIALIFAIVLVLNPVITSKIALSARDNEVVKEDERMAALEKEKRGR
ncbi:MAG: monovalent cation/H(+) antiporter subunit G [Defluviitaleaceae bacterium]|nr:monovalent cation/H(+) antiporter subunit G [Defluviitaleaceae bacterium]